MEVFRFQKAKYGNSLSWQGTNVSPARWSMPGLGLPMVYTAANKSLALLEILVHVGMKPGRPQYNLFSITIPDSNVRVIDPLTLPNGWNETPYNSASQRWGVDWLKSRAELAIAVPSVIISEMNVLINPNHKDFGSLKIIGVETYIPDERLL